MIRSIANTPVISGTINGYTGTVAFGVKAAGANGAVALEGYGTPAIGANPAGGATVWNVWGGIGPSGAAFVISPPVAGMAGIGGAGRVPDHGCGWRRYGIQYAAFGGCTVTP